MDAGCQRVVENAWRWQMGRRDAGGQHPGVVLGWRRDWGGENRGGAQAAAGRHFQRLQGGVGPQPVGLQQLSLGLTAHLGPEAGLGLGKGARVAKHEAPVARRVGACEPVALGVEPDGLSLWRHELTKLLNQPGAVHVDDDAAQALPIRVEQRRGQSDHGLVWHLDLPVFDVQVERGHVDGAGGQANGLLEKVAAALVLQRLIRREDGPRVAQVDTDLLHASAIDEAQLVVDLCLVHHGAHEAADLVTQGGVARVGGQSLDDRRVGQGTQGGVHFLQVVLHQAAGAVDEGGILDAQQVQLSLRLQ